MADSLQTARLRFNPLPHRKLDRLTGGLGVDVIDELGCVSGTLLRTYALRKTYNRRLLHGLETTAYMRPQEAWGRHLPTSSATASTNCRLSQPALRHWRRAGARATSTNKGGSSWRA